LEYENISTNCGYPIFLLSRISPYRAVSAASINKATLALIDRIKNYMRQKPPSFFINQGSEILRQAEKDYIPEHIKNFYGI
jgi:hypothetical protein